MLDLKHTVPTKLLWVDLEMTGLDPRQDVILEIAAIVTDFNFKVLARYEAQVRHNKATVEKAMAANQWWDTVPIAKQALLAKLSDGKSEDQIRQEFKQLIEQHFGTEPAVLAGNSVHADKSFLDHRWPEIGELLHYRILDVTSWKIVMQGKYGLTFTKKETHQAADDIQESIDELKYYLEYLKRG